MVLWRYRTYDDYEDSYMPFTMTKEDYKYFSFYDWLLVHYANDHIQDEEAAGESDFQYMIREWNNVTLDEIKLYTNRQETHEIFHHEPLPEIKKFIDDMKFQEKMKKYFAYPATYMDVSQFKDCSNISVYKDVMKIYETYVDEYTGKNINKNGGNNMRINNKKEEIKEDEIVIRVNYQENVDRYVADLKDLELGEAFRIVDDKNPDKPIYVVVSVDKDTVKDKVAVLTFNTAKVTHMDPKTRVWVYKKNSCYYVTGAFWGEHEVENL